MKATTIMLVFIALLVIQHTVSACYPCTCFPMYNDSYVADCKNISSLDSMNTTNKHFIAILILRDTHIHALPRDICEWNQLSMIIEVRNPYLPCNETERVVYCHGFVESDKCTYHTISPRIPTPLLPSTKPGKNSIPFQVYCCILFILTCMLIVNKYLPLKRKKGLPQAAEALNLTDIV